VYKQATRKPAYCDSTAILSGGIQSGRASSTPCHRSVPVLQAVVPDPALALVGDAHQSKIVREALHTHTHSCMLNTLSLT